MITNALNVSVASDTDSEVRTVYRVHRDEASGKHYVCDGLRLMAEHKNVFLRLFAAVRHIHCIAASSCAVERIFSSYRDVIALKRNSLLPSTINHMFVLKKVRVAV